MASRMLLDVRSFPAKIYKPVGSAPWQMVRVRGSGVGVQVAVLSGVEVNKLKDGVGIIVLVTLGEGEIIGEGWAHAVSAIRMSREKPNPIMVGVG